MSTMLLREGRPVTDKRIYRLYSEEGLSIRTRSPRRRRASRYCAGRPEADAVNECRAVDMNLNRPHSSLGNLTPSAFAAQINPARKAG